MNSRAEKPLSLKLGLVVSTLLAGVGTVVAVVAVAMGLFGNGPYSVAGEAVTRTEYLTAMLPLLLIHTVFVALFAAVAYALWKERAWSRHVMMAVWALLAAFLVITVSADQELRPGALLSVGLYALLWLAAWWHLYRKPDLVAYYDRISEA